MKKDKKAKLKKKDKDKLKAKGIPVSVIGDKDADVMSTDIKAWMRGAA